MRNFVYPVLSVVISVGFAGTASAMMGAGGPSDGWGSPYAFYSPQSSQSTAWTQDRIPQERALYTGEVKAEGLVSQRHRPSSVHIQQ
jgi:hypothetical protein